MIGNSLLTVWVSTVPVDSLGLLLGRDFLDAVGAVINFSRRMMRADLLDGSLVPLRQLAAGHFALQLAPKAWPSPGALRWRKVGLDDVVEIQVSTKDWLARKLEAHSLSRKPVHEHLVTEQSVKAAAWPSRGISAQLRGASQTVAHSAQTPRSASNRSAGTTSLQKPLVRRSSNSHANQGREDPRSMAKIPPSTSRSRHLARPWHPLVVAAAAISATLAGALPKHHQGRAVAFARRANGDVASAWKDELSEGDCGAFNMKNLAERAGFRQRQGLAMSFLEDPPLALSRVEAQQ